MSTDDRMETITDPALIRATDDPDERTTPAPSSGAGPDLGALHETICDNFTGMAEVRQAADLLVAEVRRLVKYRDWWKASSLANAEDVRRLTAICHDWRDRSEAAEAEVRRLTESRATVAANLAASLLTHPGAGRNPSHLVSGAAPGPDHARNWLDVLAIIERAALATTGEGERPKCDTCNNTGRCDWSPGEHRDTEEWDRPCIDHCDATTGEGQ